MRSSTASRSPPWAEGSRHLTAPKAREPPVRVPGFPPVAARARKVPEPRAVSEGNWRRGRGRERGLGCMSRRWAGDCGRGFPTPRPGEVRDELGGVHEIPCEEEDPESHEHEDEQPEEDLRPEARLREQCNRRQVVRGEMEEDRGEEARAEEDIAERDAGGGRGGGL